MKKILIPVDCSENSIKAVEEGLKMAKVFDSEVVLLHVVNIGFASFQYDPMIPQESMLTIIENEKIRTQKMLDSYKDCFKELPGKVETIVLEGITADEIIKYSKTSDVDFIIIGSHGGKSVFKSNIMGSVANSILHYAEKPVLIIR